MRRQKKSRTGTRMARAAMSTETLRKLLSLPLRSEGTKRQDCRFARRQPPAGRAPWMARVHLPGGLKGRFSNANAGSRAPPSALRAAPAARPPGGLCRSLRHPAFAVGTFPRFAEEGKTRLHASPSNFSQALRAGNRESGTGHRRSDPIPDFRLLKHAFSIRKMLTPPGAIQAVKAHRAATVRRVDETTLADVDADVADAPRRLEEHQIT